MENLLLYLFGAGYFIMGLGVPLAMIIAQLSFAWPVLWGSRTVSSTRRTAAGALALMCLLSGLMSLPVAAFGSPVIMALAAAFIVPAVFTLTRLHQTGSSSTGRNHHGY